MINTNSADQAPAPSRNPQFRRPAARWLRKLLWTLGIVVLALLGAAFLGILWLHTAEMGALPVLDGDLQTGGLSSPVTVRRDGHGVPHIEAATQDDLFVAQGYVTAQDRLWQMDALRRNANGDLAEILGPSMVKHDRAQRVLQFRRTAQRIYTNLPQADRARLDDYARGVNLYIDQHHNTLPAEFKILLYRPQPWTGIDSISVGLMMVQMLDTHWTAKLGRERVASDLNNPKLEADLYPVGSWRDHPPTGVLLDLSQPHPEPPGSSDSDDEEERVETLGVPGHATGELAKDTPPEPAPKKDLTPSKAPRRHEAKAPAPSANLNLRAKSRTAPKRGRNSGRLSATTKTKTPASPRGARRLKQHSALVPAPRLGELPAREDVAALRESMGLPACDGCTPGSNNWVISGQHTASGKPLLSNDMHLNLDAPNIWFMADLRAPGYHAEGVTLPGMPFVIAGHNEHVAWGFTALFADVQDLYVEQLDGNGHYQAPDGSWRPLATDHEVIHVRGGRDVTIDVQSTGHGPLLNPLFTKESRPIALKWTLYDTTLNQLPLYPINVASNWTEFSAALGTWSWPTQNVVYSDDQGHIAYHAVGRVPMRPAGLCGKPIQDSTHEWQGYIPFDSMPNAPDPPAGFLATANSRVTTETSPYALSLEWAAPYRSERIYKALQGRDKLTPADMLAVQTDVYSEMDQEFGHRIAYAIDHASNVDDRLRKAADLLRSWDGKLTTDSAAASVVTQTRQALWGMILEPRLGKDAEEYHWAESDFAEEEIVMHANPDWLPSNYKSWDDLLADAVRHGMSAGSAPGNVEKWTYGGWHVIDIEHPLAKLLPWLGKLAGTGRQPLSGDTTTVKQVGLNFGPSQRFTMDWGNVDGSTENIVLGESSDLYSPYYRDQWKDYYAGTTFAFPFTPVAVTAETRHTLRLLP